MMNDYDVKKEKTLVEQQQALSSYLDALFREMPVAEELESPESAPQTQEALVEVAPEPQAEIITKEVEVEPSPVTLLEIPVPVEVEEPSPVVVTEVVAEPVVESEPNLQAALFHPTTEFQVLFFKIGKLNLAVPLEKLAGILKSQDIKITTIPGYAPWNLGLAKNQGVTINLIDTAKFIVPGQRQELVTDRRQYRYFILIGDKQWGLGCHSLADVVTLSPDEVKWRPERGNKPWLAGTVIDKMCALLDVDGFVEMLHQKHD